MKVKSTPARPACSTQARGLEMITFIGDRKMNVHKSITIDRVCQAIEEAQISLDNPGFCLACGEDADGCEPDARKYHCESCEADMVYGAEEILIMLA